MLNISLNSLIIQRSTSQVPFFQQRAFNFQLSNSDFSKFSAPLSFRSCFTKITSTRLSNAINGAVTYVGSIQHAAIGNPVKQVYQTFSAFNCHFIKCNSKENGGAFLSPYSNGIVMFERCQFSKCSSEKEGGAIYIHDGSLQLIDCLLTECSANNGGQAVFCYGEPRYIVNIMRVTLNLCPSKTPFGQGAPLLLTKGDQFIRELNTTDAHVGGGACAFKSLQPTDFSANNIFIARSEATNVITVTNNVHRSSTLIIDNIAMINNTCSSENLIYCDTFIHIKNALLVSNICREKLVITEKKTKTPGMLNFGNNNKAKEQVETQKVEKKIFIKYENAVYGNGHQYLTNKKHCKNCKTLEGNYTLVPIKAPLTPGIINKTPIAKGVFFEKNILILCPFICIIVIIASITLSTAYDQATSRYSSII